MGRPARAAVVAELRRLVGDDAVVTEAHELARYEQGWRYGQGKALAAVRPSDTEGIARVLALASKQGIRVVPQGANTGLVGASTPDLSGDMLVLSLERMSRTLEIDAVDRTVVAGGGVLLSQLDAALAEKGLMFAIDLGADPTVGGMIATNAAGTRVLRYGDMRQNVLGLEVVLADGAVLDLMASLRKNNTGLDAKQLFVGTAGVFGIVTKAVLRIVPRPAQRATAFVGAADGATVLRLLTHLENEVGDVLTAFEVISAAALEPVFRYQPRLRNPFGSSLPAYTVLVELATTLPAGRLALDDLLESSLGALLDEDQPGGISDIYPGRPADHWDVRHHVSESLRHEGEVVAFDISVPRARIAEFVEEARCGGGGVPVHPSLRLRPLGRRRRPPEPDLEEGGRPWAHGGAEGRAAAARLRSGRDAVPRQLQRGARHRPPQPGLLRPLHPRAGAAGLPGPQATPRPTGPPGHDAARLTLPSGRQGVVLLTLAGLSLALLASMLVRTPMAVGDSGEYLLTLEAFANHGTADVRAQDAATLGETAARSSIRGAFGDLWQNTRAARDGRVYTWHFWAYPLTVLPAKLVLRAGGGNELAAPQVTNALFLLAAVWFVFLAPWLDRGVATWWSLLSLIGPPAWFCVWPHTEVFTFALVTIAVVCAMGRHFLAATGALAVASTQNPPLAPLAAVLAVVAMSRPPRNARHVAHACAALFPAFVPSLFYLAAFGRPSLMLGESADFQSVSLSKVLDLLFDLNIGLLPYIPGVVLLAVVALAVTRGPDRLAVAACWAAFFAGALGASAGTIWNFGTSGPSRYAVWLSPFLIAASAQLARPRWGVPALVVALAGQAAVLAARLPAWGEDDHTRHSYAAALVLSRWPGAYDPHPDVFLDRTPAVSENGPYVFRDPGGTCRKALAQKRHAQALADACGPLPAGFLARAEETARTGLGRAAWHYVNYAP